MNKIEYLNSNSNFFEIHYWLKDNSHSMNALVQHKCEGEILDIIKLFAQNINADIEIETVAFGEGGLKRLFKIINKNENKNANISSLIIVSMLSAFLATPITSTINELAKNAIERLVEDGELKELEKEKLKEEIINLKLDSELKRDVIKSNAFLKKREVFSNTLAWYDKIDKLSISSIKDEKSEIYEEIVIKKNEFEKFQFFNNQEIIQQDGVTIEIVSPVFGKGNYKWRAIYDGRIISLDMLSNEFKNLVQSGEVEFKNDTKIVCLLEYKLTTNIEGQYVRTGFKVLRVYEYLVNDNRILTNEGRQRNTKMNDIDTKSESKKIDKL